MFRWSVYKIWASYNEGRYVKYDLAAKTIRRQWGSYLEEEMLDRLWPDDPRRVVEEVRQEYRRIVERLANLGHDGKSMNAITLQAAYLLAVYRVSRGCLSLLDMNEIGRAAAGRYFSRPFVSSALKRAETKRRNSSGQRLLMKRARQSCAREYPGDFVYDFVEGEAEIAYGTDVRECGVQKLLMQENASELLPCICEIEAIRDYFGEAALLRTKTLADGDDICEFRYRKQR